MQTPKLPNNELQRLDAVKQYNLLDTLPESDYDNITKLVANICNVPISLITLLDSDRNFFKSHFGIPFNESPRNISFCGHAILQNDDIFVVNDARLDERFKDNPLLTEQNAIFYAGVPLINPEGYPLGTLCVFDHEPRTLNLSQIDTLKILGKQIVSLFELRRKNIQLNLITRDLENHNVELKKFASHVSHDLKSPLANITSLTQLLRDDDNSNLSLDGLEYLGYIEESTLILKDYIDGILLHYKADDLLKSKKEDVELTELFEDIKQLLRLKNDEFTYPKNHNIKNINKPALTQILLNLIDNSKKYNNKSVKIVKVEYLEDELYHKFSVSDNGIGISANKLDYIFDIFKTIETESIKSSTGIGLSTVKNLVTKLGGKISVVSKLGKGSIFTFTIKK